jgi:hypothetical protein
MFKSNDVPPLLPLLGICHLAAGDMPPVGPTEEDTRQAVYAMVRSLKATEGWLESLTLRAPAHMDWVATEAKSNLRGQPGQQGWFHFTAFDGQAVVLPVRYCPDALAWEVLTGAADVLRQHVPTNGSL